MRPKCNHKYLFKRESERDLTQGEGDMMMEAERFKDAMLLTLKMEEGIQH